MDFYKIVTEQTKSGVSVYADYVPNDVTDILFRGHAFHAVWDEDAKLWCKKDVRAGQLIDRDLWAKVTALKEEGVEAKPRLISSFRSRAWKEFLDYSKSMSDNLPKVQLDSKIVFSNQDTEKTDYVSHKLDYPLVKGDCPAWDELIGTLYSEKEREKIEWAIGSIVAGDSRKIQKFIVFYGSPGSGKGTIIEIIVEKLFKGYCTVFNAKSLASGKDAFATEAFKDNPLIAVQTDGDLSKIEDNSTLNTIVSHEPIIINPKHHSAYPQKCNAFLFMASNKPVKITDAKSGLIRRLIDVHPMHDGTQKPPIEPERYSYLKDQVGYELGAIAWHCKEVYESLGKTYYNGYRPVDMMYKTDLFFNFVEDSYEIFDKQDGTTLKAAYAMYKQYCEDSGADFRLPMYKFREELKNYFEEFADVARTSDGKQVRSYYSHFLKARFNRSGNESTPAPDQKVSLELHEKKSLLDELLAACPAQYAKEDDSPASNWAGLRTVLKDIDTGKLHYVAVPENHIVIDFDLVNENGEKDRELNLRAASKWPLTYAEFSKSGKGVHLHYIYDGDVHQLSRDYAPGIEIKRCADNDKKTPLHLRRLLTFCNALAVAHISSGLPLKESKKGKSMIDFTKVKSDKDLHNFLVARIKNCLAKKHHGHTAPEVNYIYDTLEEAYKSGRYYDVTDLRPFVQQFANQSNHQADKCLKLFLKMKWKSEEEKQTVIGNGSKMIFLDVEVFPNLFLVSWKREGKEHPVNHMFNPTPAQIEDLFSYDIVTFNGLRYDNIMLYACYLGYSVGDIYELSQRVIGGSRNIGMSESKNISYTDVFDFASTKQSLKKWEIKMGIHHQELGYPWDKPVPEEKWNKVAEYCANDVIATERLFFHLEADWTARKILAALSGLTVNDTTNAHTTRIIFGNDRNPQSKFNYRQLGEPLEGQTYSCPLEGDLYTAFSPDGKPLFPGYSYDREVVVNEKTGKETVRFVSRYRGEEVGEGGYVYAEPGVYRNVALLDIASMHPSSIVAENLFGDEYTARFRDILQARILIKHGDFDKAKEILDGKLAPFLEDPKQAKSLSGALKIAINSVYGLTSAKFDNPFRDIRNVDNIVAKRGALFMVNLKNAVQERGFTVAHIKTDSIKIPNATPEIISFVMEYGKMYGYTFEHEATYDRMCLVNDAVYIAKYSDGDHEFELPTGEKVMTPWTATGAQFQQPYVFKTLFSKTPSRFEDFCETKSVTTALYLDMNENLAEGEHNYMFVGRVGQFTPIMKGHGGGELVREKDGKYYSATGAKGYRWLESEIVRGTEIEKSIDHGYYRRMVDEAVKAISEYEDIETFLA